MFTRIHVLKFQNKVAKDSLKNTCRLINDKLLKRGLYSSTFVDVNDTNLYVINTWKDEKTSDKAHSQYTDFVKQVKEMGVNIDKGFQPKYIVSSDKKKVVTNLKSLAKKAELVWLASDEDREGEAIAWHLFKKLNLNNENTKRIVFHEITKKAILCAIENPRDINLNLVNAQQA